MRLSDYFETKLNGEVVWPHLNLRGSGEKALLATQDIEKSKLKNVSLRKTVEYYTHLDIEVEYEGRTYSTALLWDDQLFLSSLYEFLRNNIGKSIRDIGNLEYPS